MATITPQAYLFQAPTGVAGDVTRPDETNVEPGFLIPVSSVYAQAFGIPMVAVAGGFSQWGTGNVATDFQAVLIRQAPYIGGSTNQGLTGDIPNPVEVQGLAVRGYVNVGCQYGTPARDGAVYINIQATGGRVVGGFEATSQSSFNVLLTSTQAVWASDGMDANNNAELRIAR